MSKLTRTLSLNAYGKDVDGVKRSVYRGLDKQDGGKRLKAHNSKLGTVRRTFGVFFRKDVNAALELLKCPRDGKVTPTRFATMAKLGWPDSLANELLDQYADEHKPSPKPPALVEPKQGFSSLVRDLWPLYTEGRNLGLSDVGTYNPTSRLPSGRYSDHATSRIDGRVGQPACAFDLGFTPADGYANQTARAFFHRMAARPEVEYVILGNQIWSRDRGQHSYIYGGHEGHVHVSGHRR